MITPKSMNFLQIGIIKQIMKTTTRILPLLINAVLLILNSSCVIIHGNDDDYSVNFILENGTEHKIELKFFNQGKLKDRAVLSKKGDNYTQSDRQGGGGGYQAAPFIAFNSPDSLIIIFDDSRKAKLIQDPEKYNIMMLEGIDKDFLYDVAPYKTINPYKKLNKENYKFTFTEKDFENAIAF